MHSTIMSAISELRLSQFFNLKFDHEEGTKMFSVIDHFQNYG